MVTKPLLNLSISYPFIYVLLKFIGSHCKKLSSVICFSISYSSGSHSSPYTFTLIKKKDIYSFFFIYLRFCFSQKNSLLFHSAEYTCCIQIYLYLLARL